MAILILMAAIMGVSFYFLPTFLAIILKKKNSGKIALLNLFFGWSGLGWWAALILSLWRWGPLKIDPFIKTFGSPLLFWLLVRNQRRLP